MGFFRQVYWNGLPLLSLVFLNNQCETFHMLCGSVGKESTCNVGDQGLIPGLGRSPGEGKGYPLQYSGLENSTDRGAWQATVHGVTKRQTQLSSVHFSCVLAVKPQIAFLSFLFGVTASLLTYWLKCSHVFIYHFFPKFLSWQYSLKTLPKP